MFEAIHRVGRRYLVEDGLHGFPERVACPTGHGSEQLLDLRKDQFDRIQVGAVGWQEHQVGARVFDQLADEPAFVARQIVHDHHITRAKIRNEHLFHKRLEYVSVDGSVYDGRTTYATDSQGSNQCCCFPVAVWCFVDQSLSARRTAAQACHVRFGPGLIDENQAFGVDSRLDSLPSGAAPGYVGTVLLRCVDRFFLKDSPSRLSAKPTADSQQSAPSSP